MKVIKFTVDVRKMLVRLGEISLIHQTLVPLTFAVMVTKLW